MPFRIGLTELIIIVVVLALLFRGERLPELGNSMGRAIRNFHRGISGADKESTTNVEE